MWEDGVFVLSFHPFLLVSGLCVGHEDQEKERVSRNRVLMFSCNNTNTPFFCSIDNPLENIQTEQLGFGQLLAVGQE